MRLKPASAEVKVRNPATRRHLPPAGEEVADTAFWRRRLADGDVVRVEVTGPPAPARRRSPAPAEAKE